MYSTPQGGDCTMGRKGWPCNIVEVGQMLHIPLLRHEGLRSVIVRKRMVMCHCSIFAVRSMRDMSIPPSAIKKYRKTSIHRSAIKYRKNVYTPFRNKI